MKKFAFIIILSFIYHLSFSQVTTIQLTKVVGNKFGSYQVPPSEEKQSPLVVPKDLHLKYYKFFYTYPWIIEEIYGRLQKGTFSVQQYRDALQSITKKNVDTLSLHKKYNNFDSFRVHMISGIDLEGNKIFLVDANGDNKITEGEIISYSKESVDSLTKDKFLKGLMKNIPFTQIGKNGLKRTFNVQILPVPYYNQYDNELDKQISFGLLRNEHWEGRLDIKGKKISISAEPTTFNNEIDDFGFNYRADSLLNIVPISVKDYFATKTFSLIVDSAFTVDTNQIGIKISYQSPPRPYSDTTFKVAITNVHTGKQEILNGFLKKNKFILVDYWGTWCTPCIEKLPILKNMAERFSSKLTVIGIAYDHNIEKVKAFDIDQKINWPSYFIDRGSSQRTIKALLVTSFPTYRLYNDSGSLIMAGSSASDLEKMSLYILKH